MLYCTPPSTPIVREAIGLGQLAAIATPKQGNRIQDGWRWIADNGCYGKGWPGRDGYLKWLDGKRPRSGDCLFATAPDVVGDAQGTLDRSAGYYRPIRERGFTPALVGQDGLESLPIPWESFGAFFIGGSTAWKLGAEARAIVAEAKRRGKWVHMGRVNSAKRWDYARLIGCDSVDGTFLVFGPTKNLPILLSWFEDKAYDQVCLFGGAYQRLYG